MKNDKIGLLIDAMISGDATKADSLASDIVQTTAARRVQESIKVKPASISDLGEEEGIVLLGAGGDTKEWIDGVTASLHDEGISTSANPDDLWKSAQLLTTTGGRTDLVLTFKSGAPINIGKMAMWRLRFGDCSWISDYRRNYASQHGLGDLDSDD